MKIQTLLEGQLFLTETKCAIYNTLIKFRPDLKDDMDRVSGRKVGESVQFLKYNGLWDDTAEEYFQEFMYTLRIYQQGPDDWSQDEMKKAQDNFMCHVAKLIRDSAR